MFVFHSIYVAPSTPPKDIVAEKVTDTSVEMSWKAPDPSTTNGVISSYRVLFKKWEMVNFRRIGPLEIPRGESDDSVTAPMLSGRITTNDTGVVLRNLSPSTLYSITVSAATGAGRGPESAPVLVTTLEPQGDGKEVAQRSMHRASAAHILFLEIKEISL